MVLTHRRAQHKITFGCETVVCGRVVSPVTIGDGPIFKLQASTHRVRNNKTKQKVPVVFLDMHFSYCGVGMEASNDKS
jgi:hypothetical protein